MGNSHHIHTSLRLEYHSSHEKCSRVTTTCHSKEVIHCPRLVARPSFHTALRTDHNLRWHRRRTIAFSNLQDRHQGNDADSRCTCQHQMSVNWRIFFSPPHMLRSRVWSSSCDFGVLSRIFTHLVFLVIGHTSAILNHPTREY